MRPDEEESEIDALGQEVEAFLKRDSQECKGEPLPEFESPAEQFEWAQGKLLDMLLVMDRLPLELRLLDALYRRLQDLKYPDIDWSDTW